MVKRGLVIVCSLAMFLLTSCATMDHWLYGASDYFINEDSTDTENDLYWDDFEWDIWTDEYEYD